MSTSISRDATPPRAYRLPLKSIAWETPAVATVHLDAGSHRVAYLPGQYGVVRYEGVFDPRGPTRPFSFSSSPTERGTLAFTVRSTGSPFKTRLLATKPGEEVDLRAPLGRFILRQDTGRPALMVAHGIGATPLRSMIKYATDMALPLPITLVQHPTAEDERPFGQELVHLMDWNPYLQVLSTKDTVEAHALGPYLDDPRGVDVYVAGPPGRVEETLATLVDLGVPGDRILWEKFTGYRD